MSTDAQRGAQACQPFDRFRPDVVPSDSLIDPLALDRMRVMNSRAFHRLGGVTQVLSDVTETRLLYTRLTHSLRVANTGYNMAKRIQTWAEVDPALAQRIEGFEPMAVEIAGLCHDLGHPPFGHIGEQVLDEVLKGEGKEGFEGNAQSFRILVALGFNDNIEHPGLNLTRKTLDGVLKYPWVRAREGKRSAKWSVYRTERGVFDWAHGANDVPCLEAQVMDWADDASYALHDLLDFWEAGLIDTSPFSLEQAAERVSKEGTCEANEDALGVLNRTLPHGRFLDWTSRVRLTHFTESMAEFFSRSFRIDDNANLEVDPVARAIADIVKAMMRIQVIDRPAMLQAQEGQRRTLRNLFYVLLEWSRSGNMTAMHPLMAELEASSAVAEYERTGDEYWPRLVSDFLASLTDGECVGLLGTLTGRTYGSVIGPWTR